MSLDHYWLQEHNRMRAALERAVIETAIRDRQASQLYADNNPTIDQMIATRNEFIKAVDALIEFEANTR